MPDDFEVPAALEGPGFRLRPLTVSDVVKDFEAVVASRQHLRRRFGTSEGWLSDDHDLVQNLVDLGWHQKNHQRREAFTYTVVALDESRVLGCVYIDPCADEGVDAEVHLWARPDSTIEPQLEQVVQAWLESDWPFDIVVFPDLAAQSN